MCFKILLCLSLLLYIADAKLLDTHSYEHFIVYITKQEFKLTCLNYNGLDNLDVIDMVQISDLKPNRELSFIFENCFNTETKHGNYRNFSVQNLVKKFEPLKYFKVAFQQYGVIDERVFYRDVNFSKYEQIHLKNIGGNDTKILSHANPNYISLDNINYVDFDDFTETSLNWIVLHNLSISHFTRTNLEKLRNIRMLEFYDFSFDDYNALNVANLFAANSEILFISLIRSSTHIILHEEVFTGLLKLVEIILQHLNLEEIPKNLFRGLPHLVVVQLDGNNFKTLDPHTFISNPLHKLIIFGGSLWESKTSTNLILPHKLHLIIKNVTIDSYNSIKDVTLNSNITYIEIADSNLTNIQIKDFNQIRNRSNTISIILDNLNFKFTLAELRSQKINYDIQAPTELQYNNLNAVIKILWHFLPCPHCVFDSEMFMLYLNGKFDNLNIYLKDSKILFQINPNYRIDLEKFYKFPYSENCPELCKCHHNPLLDDIEIVCTNRGLTSIPKISWPSQFDKIDLIELDLSKNLLTTISFGDQDYRIVQHLSVVHFKNNLIENIDPGAEAGHLSNQIPCLDVDDLFRNTSFGLQNNTNVCSLKSPVIKDSFQYIRKKSDKFIKNMLDAMPCDRMCF